MNFTYEAYEQLLKLLMECNYEIKGYHDWRDSDRCVILRHDIDNSMEQAARIAELEADLGAHSTFFVLLRTDFYNIASLKSQKAIKKIKSLGHEIGLHFDEVAYEDDSESVQERILKEADILGDICGCAVKAVSMHRPSRQTLEADLRVPGLVNSYGETFLHGFKYLSDSRRHWREPVLDIIRSGEYNRLHILTHAFWYHQEDYDISKTVGDFIRSANQERYCQMQENIRDLQEMIDVNAI